MTPGAPAGVHPSKSVFLKRKKTACVSGLRLFPTGYFMSMCLYLTSGCEAHLAGLARDPERLMAGMSRFGRSSGGFDPEAVARLRRQIDLEARRSGLVGGFIMKMMAGRMFKDVDRQLKAANDDGATVAAPGAILDLHKSWQILHFLFTDTAFEGRAPADALLNGGKEIGQDLGHGAPRLLSPKEVAAFADFLGGQTVEGLKARIDTARMSRLEIYCAEDGDADGLEEIEADVEAYFPMLRDFAEAAAANGDGLLIWMA
jgi:hypothetical protein